MNNNYFAMTLAAERRQQQLRDEAARFSLAKKLQKARKSNKNSRH